MAEVDHEWSLSNPGPERLLVWLEPWAEEFEVPVRSTIALSDPNGSGRYAIGEVEWTPDHLVIWASTPGTIEVSVDGVPQQSGSAVIPSPDGLTKQMLKVVFAGLPAARLGGQPFELAEAESWWRRMRRRIGI
jgi:hypothetical protein